MELLCLNKRFTRLLTLPGVALLAACTTKGPPPDLPASAARAPAPAETERYREPEVAAYRPPARPNHARPQTARAVQALLHRAEQQQADGRLAEAANTLERALRIEPENALLWNRLAHVRFAQGQYRQAANLAVKSKSLAGDDLFLRDDNDLLIQRAQARR